MLAELIPLLLLGFGLGLMHALDADHIMAVSVLSSRSPSIKKTLLYSANWAIGHGGVLLVSGALLFGLGLSIPPALQQGAEIGVGVMLIILGIMCVVRIRQEKLTLAVHSHGDLVHAHWHKSGQEHVALNVHKPALVGVLHGLAGSAPALALIPAVASGKSTHAMVYLVIFSLGVMLSMLVFGLGFARIQHYLIHRYRRVFDISRHVLAAGSIGLGGFWLAQAI